MVKVDVFVSWRSSFNTKTHTVGTSVLDRPLLAKMKRASLFRLRQAAFTLVELMVAATIYMGVFGALLSGVVALQRSMSANSDYSVARGDQMRIADYVGRDLRRALAAPTVGGSAVALSLTVPDYYNRSGTADNTRDDVTNTPTRTDDSSSYGTAPVTVRYLRRGQSIVREETFTVAGATTAREKVIGTRVSSFSVVLNTDNSATTSIGYVPRFRLSGTIPASNFVIWTPLDNLK